MKQTWKKIFSIVLMGVLFAALTACGGKKDESTGLEVSEDIQSQLIQSAQSAVEAIVVMDDETIQSYLESEDAFSVSAMEAWQGSRDELGAYVSMGDAALETDKEMITVTIPTKFEKEEALFTITFDKKYAATSMGIDIQYTMGTKLQRAGMNTLMGVGIVFLMLIFLSFLIYLFKFIPAIADKFKKSEAAPQKTAPAAETAPAAAPALVQEKELVDDGELVAVIAAAIAASENTSTDSFVVRSIRKSNKRNWQRA